MIKTRQCQVAGHEMNSAIHICTYKDCALTSKWVCADCSFEQLHSHGQQNQNHIMKEKQFLEFTVSQSQAIFDQSNQHASLIQQCIKQLDQFVQSTVMFKNLLEKDLGRVNKIYKISELENIMKIVNNEFQILQKQQIELIINLKNNQPQFDFNLSQDLLKQVIMQVQNIQLLIAVDDKQRLQEQQQFEQEQISFVQSREQQQGQQDKLQIQQQQVQVKQQQINQEKELIQIQQVKQVEQQQTILAKEKQDVKQQGAQVQDINQKVYSDLSDYEIQISEQDINQKVYSDYFDFESYDGLIYTSQISEDEKIQDINQNVYSYYFDFNSSYDCLIYTSQISEDEKYLAIGGNNCKLRIYDLNTKKQIQQLEINKHVSMNICRFTKDSRYLICGDSSGYLYCYDIRNNFSQIYNKQIHQKWINDILVINNNQIITCSDDKSIIITNMPSLQNNLKNLNSQTDQALKICYNDSITRIDYDYEKDLIISCSENRYISFFMKQNGNKIFEQQVSLNQDIGQIQIIPNNKIICSDSSSLIMFQIDYDLNKLKQIREFKQDNCNFTFIDNSKIIILCEKQLCICDDNFNLLYSQKFEIISQRQFRTRQINSTKYIIIPNRYGYLEKELNQIKVIKRQ